MFKQVTLVVLYIAGVVMIFGKLEEKKSISKVQT